MHLPPLPEAVPDDALTTEVISRPTDSARDLDHGGSATSWAIKRAWQWPFGFDGSNENGA